MSADATAAGLYESGVSKFNPLESFLAGVQTAHAAKRLALAESGALFDNVVKQQSLQLQHEELAQKSKALEDQNRLSWFNAETNRINATRTLKSNASSPGGTVPTTSTDEDGNLILSYAPPATTANAPQAPTEGEGDGPEVTPLSPSTSGASPSLLPPPPASQVKPGPGPSRISTTGDPTGMSPPDGSFPYAPNTTNPKQPRQYVTGGSTNTKTGSNTLNWSTTKPGSTKEGGTDAPISPQMFKDYKSLAESEGMTIADMEGTAKGLNHIKLTPKEGSGDVSISSLPAEEQKRWGQSMAELVTLANDVRESANLQNLSPAQVDAKKMAAVGKTDPKDMTPEDWVRGYQLITPAGSLQRLYSKAFEYASLQNLTFAGKKGYVTRTAESVLGYIGVTPPKPGLAPSADPSKVASTPAAQQTAAPQSGAPSEDADTQTQIAALKQEIATEKDPKMRNRKQLFLDQLQTRAKSQSAAAPQEPADPFAAIAQSKTADEVAQEQMAPKKELDRQRWEASKQTVLKKMVAGGGRDLISNLSTADVGDDQTAGKSRESKWSEWLDANRGKVNLKTKDGKPVESLEDILWVDADGRKITLRDVISAALQDPRTQDALKAPARSQQRQTAVAQENQGLTEQEKALLNKK